MRAAQRGFSARALSAAGSTAHLSGSCDSWRVVELGRHSTVERRGNCNYREVQPGDDPEHVIGCDGLLDGFEAKRPFLLVSW